MDEEKTIQSQQEVPEQTGAEQDEIVILKKKSEEFENTISQLKDQLLRKAAEFDNYKKRTENEFASMVKFASEDLIAALLPVLDDFHRSIKVSQSSAANGNTQDQNGSEAIRRGMELIYNKFMKILEGQGVKTFDSVGKTFDPFYHDALLQVPKSDVPPHTIIEEVEKGYMLNDKVIRHAKVIVSGEEASEGTAE